MEKTVKTYLRDEVRVWLNRTDGKREVILIIPAYAPVGHQSYELYTAYDESRENLGRILFDDEGYWIYDGADLTVPEQEQISLFITNYLERML